MTIDNPNTMKVLITGGGGFLGSRLARTILQRGHLSGRPIAELVLADLVPPPPDVARRRACPRLHGRIDRPG